MKLLLISTDIDHVEPYQYVGAHLLRAELRVICAHDCINLEAFEEHQIPIKKIHFSGWRSKSNINDIRQSIDDFQPDIVHVLRKKALLNTIPAMSESKAKLVVYRGIVGNLSFFDPVSLLSFLNPRVDRIVCVADAIRRHFVSMGFGPVKLDPEKLLTIHKGHVVEKYANVPKADLSKYGVPAGHKVIGFCGSMRPRKGIHNLVQAFSVLDDKNTALLLVGDLNNDKVRDAIANSTRTNKIFTVSKVPQAEALSIAGSFDVATMPSTKREGLPRALIESMAQGVPAVVTNIGGSPELVEHGKSGFVVPPNDVSALRDALNKILDAETLQLMGSSAAQRIKQHFHVNDTIERNSNLYMQLLGR